MTIGLLHVRQGYSRTCRRSTVTIVSRHLTRLIRADSPSGCLILVCQKYDGDAVNQAGCSTTFDVNAVEHLHDANTRQPSLLVGGK